MRIPVSLRYLAALFILGPAAAEARDIHYDLADIEPNTIILQPGEPFTLRLYNSAPHGTYKIDTTLSEIELKPLEPKLNTSGQNNAKFLAQQCAKQVESKLNEFITRLENQDIHETEVSKVIEDFYTLNNNHNLAACSEQVKTIKALIGSSTRIVANLPSSLTAGYEIKITIRRFIDNRLSRTPWILTITTGSAGRWTNTFGFSFLPNMDQSYHLLPTGAGTYTIMRTQDRNGMQFIPTAFWTWQNAGSSGKAWSGGPTAGIGLKIESPAVFVGYNLIYRQNIGFTLGLAMHQQKRLSGKYTEGQIILDNNATLHEDVYQANYFLSVIFRFGSSPF